VDNVRDANYYEPNTPDGQTYIAGFFWSLFNDYFDRNVMTIDAFDWVHRTGANPPDDSGEAAYVACTEEVGGSTPLGTPRPRLYEGVFAHEYQHLLEHYVDPDEVNWINEGLSDWAQSLVGYVDLNVPHDQPGADSHVSCFQGWLEERFGGPENSLTAWGDQGGPEILCDYGAAYSIMQMLHGRYGDEFMTELHRSAPNGLAALDAALTHFVTGKDATQVLHEWAALMALDASAGTSLTGGAQADYTSDELFSEINQGSATLPTEPIAWTSVTDAPGRAGNAVLYSGFGDNRDEAIVKPVSFGAAPSLSFAALWNEEDFWDFGFVQVSTDAGETYQSLTCTDTTTTTDPGALPTAKNNVPGLHGLLGRLEDRDLQRLGARQPVGAAGLPDVQRPEHARLDRRDRSGLLGRRRHRRRRGRECRRRSRQLAVTVGSASGRSLGLDRAARRL
jgi:hypothetical protein